MRFSIIHLATAFSVGIFISFLSIHASRFGIVFLLITFTSAALGFFAFLKKKKAPCTLLILLSSFLCFLGILRGQMYDSIPIPTNLFQSKVTIQAEVIEPSTIKDSSQSVTVAMLDSNNTVTSIHILITLPPYPRVYVGERYAFTGELQKGEMILPLPPMNYTSFDYGAYLGRKGIVGTMVFPKVVKRGDEGESFYYLLYDVREYLASHISAILPSPQSALVNGILFGKDELPKEENNAIRAAGLSHITVLSGFNITVLMVLVMFLLRRFPLVFRISISAVIILLFVMATGSSASLIRASIMAYVALLAFYLGRPYDALYSLFFSLFVFGVISPEVIVYDASFHLSFLATLGLLLLNKPIVRRFETIPIPEFLKVVIISSLAVLVYTTPYLVHTFSQLSLYSIVANVFVVPIIAPLMGVMSTYLILSFIPFLGTCVSFIGYLMSSYVLFVAHAVADLPFASVPLSLSSFGMCLSYAVILITTYFFSQKKKSTDDDTIISF